MAKHKSKDLKTKTTDELKDQLKLLRKEQFNLRFQLSNGQNENPARSGLIRKEIACIKTILNKVVSTKDVGKQNIMPKRILTGKVTSNKSDKTITVLVERKIMVLREGHQQLEQKLYKLQVIQRMYLEKCAPF